MPTSKDLVLETNRRESAMKTIQESHYLDALLEFIRRCDQEQVMLDWIRTRIPNLLNVLPVDRCDKDNPIRVIGVGCGNGIMDAQILREVNALNSSIHEIAVEPNEAELLRFKARIDSDNSLKQSTFDWIQSTTEAFEASMNRLIKEDDFAKVHFIHMLQMLYHARDMERTVSNYYNALHDGGLLLITIASKQNNELFKSFQELEPSTRCTKARELQKNKKRYSEDVTRLLHRMGLQYEAENVAYRLDITECFKEDSHSGRVLLDFLCLTNASSQVYQTLTAADRDRLMKRLMDHCEEHADGRVTVRLSFDAISVTKKDGHRLPVTAEVASV